MFIIFRPYFLYSPLTMTSAEQKEEAGDCWKMNFRKVGEEVIRQEIRDFEDSSLYTSPIIAV